jgi:mannose-6-phosphate isomerase-like protein (cupin superfamily)
MVRKNWLFGSLFLGGFECSTHVTVEGRRLNLIAATQHDTQARDDYALCRKAGIRAVREAALWPINDREGKLNLESVRRLARLGKECGLVQIWDLMHYGYPDDVDPFSPQLTDRFAAFARAVAEVVREETEGPTYYTPVNEISYNAWSGGQVAYIAPFGEGRGGELKRALVRAAIESANAIWEVDPEAQMVTVDPLVRLHPPPGRPDLQGEADHFNRHIVTEAFDLLSGRLEPELGGTRRHLGILGLNYYAGNQWTLSTPEEPQQFLDWHHEAWIPVNDLLAELQDRYGGPLIIAETGSSGDGRPEWLTHLAGEAKLALSRGVDLQGICLYPIVTSPDWEDTTAFFDGGLFDVSPEPGGLLRRIVAAPVAAALRKAQAELDPANLPLEPLEAEEPPAEEPTFQLARLEERARFKVDNFSYQTLFAGEQLAVELYGFEPGASLPAHKHDDTEHVWTIISGIADVRIGSRWFRVKAGETMLAPAGLYHGIHNPGSERLIVQQVSGPKPWDARFGAPHPSTLAPQI